MLFLPLLGDIHPHLVKRLEDAIRLPQIADMTGWKKVLIVIVLTVTPRSVVIPMQTQFKQTFMILNPRTKLLFAISATVVVDFQETLSVPKRRQATTEFGWRHAALLLNKHIYGLVATLLQSVEDNRPPPTSLTKPPEQLGVAVQR